VQASNVKVNSHGLPQLLLPASLCLIKVSSAQLDERLNVET
jgi:hypothetical protein